MSDPRLPDATPPPPPQWEAATRDYLAGRVYPLTWKHRDEVVPLRVTATWNRQWKQLVHGAQARSDIRAACLHIARGRVHPALGVQPVPHQYGTGLMASPSLGWTLSWRMDAAGVPVFLTLTHTP